MHHTFDYFSDVLASLKVLRPGKMPASLSGPAYDS